jgi:hypothetical protein
MSEYKRMLHLRQVHHGKYQNAEDYIRPDGSYREMTLALDWVDKVDFDKDGGGTETKPVLHFLATSSGKQPLPMSVCKESWQAIAGMIAPIRGEWINNADPNGPSWKGFRITFTAEVFKKTKEGDMEGIRPIGSPDIDRDIEVTIQLYTKIRGKVVKRKPFTRLMRRTGNGGPPTQRGAGEVKP